MAAHYDTAILPARPRRPRDKAKVEVAVLIIERWLLGRLRHRRFYSLAELNATISELLRQLNEQRPIRRLGVTRQALFEELDRPNLNSLPAQPYCFAEWRLRRVGVDYHVELEGHFYSVPYRFARSEVEVRLTPRTVEIFLKGERIAAHLRASGNHRHTTLPFSRGVPDLSGGRWIGGSDSRTTDRRVPGGAGAPGSLRRASSAVGRRNDRYRRARRTPKRRSSLRSGAC